MGNKTDNEDREPYQRWKADTGKNDFLGDSIHTQEQRGAVELGELQTNMPNVDNIPNMASTNRKKTSKDRAHKGFQQQEK